MKKMAATCALSWAFMIIPALADASGGGHGGRGVAGGATGDRTDRLSADQETRPGGTGVSPPAMAALPQVIEPDLMAMEALPGLAGWLDKPADADWNFDRR